MDPLPIQRWFFARELADPHHYNQSVLLDLDAPLDPTQPDVACSTFLETPLADLTADHVRNLAFNALCGGTCLEDLELLRNDEAYLDALGTQRIPDPTTATRCGEVMYRP